MMKHPSLLVLLKQYGRYQHLKGSSKATIQKYYGDILHIFAQCQKITIWWTITASDIEKTIYAQKWKESTKATYIFEMRSFLSFCLMEGIPVDHPKKILCRKLVKKEAKSLNRKEIDKILKYVDNNIRYKALILLFLTTGLRLSEVCSLTKKQISAATLVGEVYQITVIGKGKKLRSVFLPLKTREICGQLRSISPSNVVGMKKHKVQYAISRISTATRVKFTAHTLRHTYLSYLAKSGVDLYKIQKIAGHSSLLTTSLYLHCSNKELALAASLSATLM